MASTLRSPLLLLLAGMGSCAASWVASDRMYRAGSTMPAYWLGVAGSALPALVFWLSVRYLRKRRTGAGPDSAEKWFAAGTLLALVFLGLMAVFPLL